MLRFADLIEKNAGELASWESKAMGMPIQVATMILSMTAEVFRCMSTPLVLAV
jgi:aldehyde dehydrogenase (NAD+)